MHDFDRDFFADALRHSSEYKLASRFFDGLFALLTRRNNASASPSDRFDQGKLPA